MALPWLPGEVDQNIFTLWEIILERLDDSTDILNGFKVFPSLERDGVLRSTRTSWLFEQVVWHIVPWLAKNDVLTLRQVCRKWSRGVDNFLENHPTLRAYQPGEHVPGRLWIPEASPKSYRLWKYFSGTKIFVNSAMLRKFQKKFADHPPERNPFVGRSVYITDQQLPLVNDDPVEFWTRTFSFLRKYGKHVWFLDFHIHSTGRETVLMRLLLSCLSSLPNLKALRIHGWPASSEPPTSLEEMETRLCPDLFQPLPHLETLQIMHTVKGIPQILVDALVMCHSPLIRRLYIPSWLWRKQYANYFPNLTQLTLEDDEESGISKTHISNFLLNLDAPQLSMLAIGIRKDNSFFMENNVVQWLKRFPRIHSLEIGSHLNGGKLPTDSLGWMTLSTEVVPSLTDLTIYGFVDDMNFAFLQCFPSLEYLDIKGIKQTPDYFQNMPMYNRKIWKVLPRLREITLGSLIAPPSGRSSSSLLHFRREKYEWLQKKKKKSVKRIEKLIWNVIKFF